LPFTAHVNKCNLLIQDYLTKKIILAPFMNKEPMFNAANLQHEVLLTYGCLRHIQIDHSGKFAGPVMDSITAALEISRSVSSAHHM